jgi:signal transduction histidine kinase
MKDPASLFQRYQELQHYVGWGDDDVERVRALAPLLEPHLPALIEDFYAEIERHPEAARVFTGGQAQVDRLKNSLLSWLRDLLSGPYDRDYVVRRWKVGMRHVEIGLDQLYTNVALARLRSGMVRALGQAWTGAVDERLRAIESLNKLLDLDLAKIEDAYQTESIARRQGIERLATLGQVAGGVAHELRNPLNIVKSSAYYLMNARNLTPEKKDEHLRRIERSVDMANDVITALSNFARMPLPDMQPFSVDLCIQDALEDSAMPSGIEVVVAIAPDLPQALADRAQIRIVVGNLIRNARDAMPSGGRLTITGRAVPDGLEISVADTGVGIAPGDLARVTEPLYSTKARGLGLGLALSQMILDKNQGSLQVASELGRGSTFTITLAAAGAG